MNPRGLGHFTNARVSLGQTGDSLPVRDVLELQLAHARAREAVYSELDVRSLSLELQGIAEKVMAVRSAVPDRQVYLRRPDLGRRLSDDSRRLLVAERAEYDAVFMLADGLSALAINRHAVALLQELMPLLPRPDWHLAPFVIVEQGRVAIGDEIGEALDAALSVVLIGERPGLSSNDSLGIYLTWNPRTGLTDADRNCISNIHGQGWSYRDAANTLAFLMTESRRRQLSGVGLKEEAQMLADSPSQNLIGDS